MATTLPAQLTVDPPKTPTNRPASPRIDAIRSLEKTDRPDPQSPILRSGKKKNQQKNR